MATQGHEETTDPEFFGDLREDILEEVGKNGDVLDCKVLKATAGHVIIKFADVNGAQGTIAKHNGRWFAGKQIGAEFSDEAAFEAA